MNATHILGIDIAKLKFDVNLRTLGGQGPRYAAVFNNGQQGFKALGKWLAQHGVALSALHACLEATSRYGDRLAAWLHSQAAAVSMVNPRRTRHYANSRLSRTLNDRIEAGLIADFCAAERQDLTLWEPLPSAHRQLQDLTRARQALVEYREGFANLLETATGVARQSCQRQIRALNKEIQRLEQALQKFLQQQAPPALRKQVALADTVTGVALVTAATVIAELPPMEKIQRGNQAVALFGLDPRNKTSGSSVDTPARLSRMGSRRGRRALYMPALTALRCNPAIKAMAQRLEQKGRSGKYIVVAAMRKLLRIIFAVVKNERPYDPNWQPRRPGQTSAPAVQWTYAI